MDMMSVENELQTHEYIDLLDPKEVCEPDTYQNYHARQVAYLQTRADNFLAAHPELMVSSRRLYEEEGKLNLLVRYVAK